MSEDLTVSQKIGQIVMPRVNFNDSGAFDYAKELILNFHVGGFIIFGGEIESVKEATRELQAISEIPLFFGCDAERGLGQVISGATHFPFAMSLGAAADRELVFRQAQFIAAEMRYCGFNLNFAPVLDVNTNPENPIINIRSYGDDAELVSRLGKYFITGLQNHGVLACGKHFPGHGSVEIDSHVELPSLEKNMDELNKCEIIPFKTALEADVAGVMIAHLAVPEISGARIPATISQEIVGNLLRQDLGFEGLAITDSFRMDSVAKMGVEEDTSQLSLAAGCDIILDPGEPKRLLRRLLEMVDTGELSESLLDSPARRIASAKRRWLENGDVVNSFSKEPDANLAEEISRRSVCLLKGGRITSLRAKVYVFDMIHPDGDSGDTFARRLEEAGISCERVTVSPTSTDTLFQNKLGDEASVCLVYTSPAAWKSTTVLQPFSREFLMRIGSLDSEKILVSFGSPYVVRGFENFDTVLLSFDHFESCQLAAANVLLGEINAKGVLPVTLN